MSVYVQGQGLGPGQGLSQVHGPGLGGSIEEGTSVYVQGQGLSQIQGLGQGLGFGSVEEGTSVYVQGPGLSQGQVLRQTLGQGLGQGLGSVEEGTSVYVPTSSTAQEPYSDPNYWNQYKSFGGGWIECFTEEGYLYYYNHISGMYDHKKKQSTIVFMNPSFGLISMFVFFPALSHRMSSLCE